MSRKSCSVFNCNNSSKTCPELTYFRLPADDERRAEWLRLIDRLDLTKKNPHHYVVCEVHFNKNNIFQKPRRKVLRVDTVPTLHLPPQRSYTKGRRDVGVQCTETLDRSTQTGRSWRSRIRDQLMECRQRLINDRSINNKLYAFYKLSDAVLTKELSGLVQLQTHLKAHKKRGKNSHEFELFCIYLYYTSPKAYRVLRSTLGIPCFGKLVNSFTPVTSAVGQKFMAILKAKVDNMNYLEKVCSVMVCTKSVKPSLYYNIGQDKIIGFCEVDGVQSHVPANKALVVLVRSIHGKWTQPVGYALLSDHDNDKIVSTWIDKLLKNLLDIGLDIKALVDDSSLSKKKRDISVETPYFFIDSQKIYYLFDIAHLMNIVLKSFMSNNFHFQNSVAKWEHVTQFYDSDNKKSQRLAPNLTEDHVRPKQSHTTGIPHYEQLISRSVAAGIATYVDFQAIDESARATVDFIVLMNDLLDVLNPTRNISRSEAKKIVSDQIMIDDNYQISVLKKTIDFFSTLKLINSISGCDATSHAAFIEAFQITIRSILLLSEDFKLKGDILCTSRLNLDVLNRFLAKLRNKNDLTNKLTSRQFTAAFHKFVRSNFMKTPPRHGSDDVERLLENTMKLEYLICTVKQQPDYNLVTEDNIVDNLSFKKEPVGESFADSFCVEEQPLFQEGEFKISTSDYHHLDIPKTDQTMYICGFLLKKSAQQSKYCQMLRIMVKNEELPEDIPVEFVKFVEDMEKQFKTFFKLKNLNCKVFKTMYERINDIDFNVPCLCFPVKYIKMLYVRLRIYHTIKFNNNAFRKSKGTQKHFTITM